MAQDLSTSVKASPKESFIESLMAAGERRLLDGDQSGLELLATAADLAPNEPQLFHKQGLAIFDYACNGNPKALHIANKRFKKATELSPQMFESWLSWANCLFLLGSATGEQHYFLSAKEKFELSLQFAEGQPPEFLLDLHWNYGLCMGRIAMHSEDPLDLQLAYSAFQKASTLNEEQPTEFWCDFGHLALRLYGTLGEIKYLHLAVDHYKLGTQTETASQAAWTYLGDAQTTFYGVTSEPEHAERASDCYAKAATLCPTDAKIWLKWAHLLCVLGKTTNEPKAFCASIEKCHKARSFGANEVELTCIWAETLSGLGSAKNRLKHLRKAEDMLDELSLKNPDDPAVFASYGRVLLDLGDYFNCVDIYFRAVEAFQSATSLDRTFHSAWHALGTCYMTLAEHEDDYTLQLERAVRFFSKALNLRPDPTYHFDLGDALYRLADEKTDKNLLEHALHHIETALEIQKNAPYTCIDWIYTHASALALAGQLHEEESYFIQSLDLLHHILMAKPDYPDLNYRFALVYNAYADTVSDTDLYYRSFHHYRIAHMQDPDNDVLLHDWSLALMHLHEIQDTPQLISDAENKLFQAIKLGNSDAYYTIANLYTTQGKLDLGLFYLEKAHKFLSLPDIEELLEDEWLEPLHDVPAFQEFIARVQKDPSNLNSGF